MNKEFVSYVLAVALKELGFDEMCFGFYSSPVLELMHCKNSEPWMGNGVVAAPLKQQVFRWFMEKYNLRGFIGFRPNVKQFDCHVYDMSLSGMEYVKQRTMEEFNKDPKVGTYEEAENACIDKLIELAKQQSNIQIEELDCPFDFTSRCTMGRCDCKPKQQDNGK